MLDAEENPGSQLEGVDRQADHYRPTAGEARNGLFHHDVRADEIDGYIQFPTSSETRDLAHHVVGPRIECDVRPE